MNFKEKLKKIYKKNDSLLCVGLDIDKEKMPNISYFDFNKDIVDKTKDLVCCYKINMAFYEVLGIEGFNLLKETINYIPKEIPIILDGKRNDIGNTAKKYAKSIFETLNYHATTVNPYLGIDGVKPFIDYKDKYCFILCRTSNPSAVDLQDLDTSEGSVFEIVSKKIKEWNKINNNCGAVVGATYPEELKKIRKILGDNVILLIPGIGAQGGDVEKTIKFGTNKDGEKAIINSSRGIIYAGSGKDFYEKSSENADELRKQINKYR